MTEVRRAGDREISATANALSAEEEDGTVAKPEEPQRCEAVVPNGGLHRCGKEKGHKYSHLVKVKDTTYQWGDMGNWSGQAGKW